ncbi:MAG: DNA polymerase Y family protein [Alphaproteobacteria bacterium]|nr:DNA polymerase Y family protein [Alphaproteobacteria bacterium]
MALWLPRLPTDRLIRKSGAPEAPLVVSGRANNALIIHALEARAEKLGLYRGQPLANAHAMVQPLNVVPADEKADAALLENIADWCDRFTPLVSLDAPDGLYLDITGAAHLFGGDQAMLKDVLAKLSAQGFAVRGAIAGTSWAARALARHQTNALARGGSGFIVPPGGEAEAVASLPITAFDCDAKILRALSHAGLKTVGQVAARQSSELAERLGIQFVRRLLVMLGQAEEPLAPRRPLPDLMAEQRFADPVTSREAIASTLLALAQSLGGLLERQGQGARMLGAAFFRADGKVDRIAVRAGAPVRDPTIMLRLLNQKLDALADPLDPGFGFDLVRLEALLAETTSPATVSFDANENARRQVRFLIDRLSARFGEHRVLRFVPQDTHIPEAAAVAVPAQDSDFDATWPRHQRPDDPPRRPCRLLEKPEEIHHVMADTPDAPPVRFRWRQCLHHVARAEGPERIVLEWWSKDGPTRDYFRVETREGQRFWLYRDGLYRRNGLGPRWYLQGIFA